MSIDSNNTAPVQDDALGWDCEISGEVKEFVPLEPGEYPFFVKDFKRGYFNGSAKSSACPKLELKLDFGETTIKHDLFWRKSNEWQIARFFICIGQQQPGQPCRPNWNTLIGASGIAKVKIDEWTGNDGKPHKSNKIERFLVPDQNSDGVNPFTQPVQAVQPVQPTQTTMQGYQPPPNQWQGGGWKPGSF